MSLAIPSWLALTASVEAQPVNPLLVFLSTACSTEELGKVIRVAVLDAKQANAIYKKGKAPEVAKQGDIYIQIFSRSKAVPNDYLMSKLKRAPTTEELADLSGRPNCTIVGE